MFGGSAENQHGQPAVVGIEGGGEHAFADGSKATEVVVRAEQGLESAMVGCLHELHDADGIEGDWGTGDAGFFSRETMHFTRGTLKSFWDDVPPNRLKPHR